MIKRQESRAKKERDEKEGEKNRSPSRIPSQINPLFTTEIYESHSAASCPLSSPCLDLHTLGLYSIFPSFSACKRRNCDLLSLSLALSLYDAGARGWVRALKPNGGWVSWIPSSFRQNEVIRMQTRNDVVPPLSPTFSRPLLFARALSSYPAWIFFYPISSGFSRTPPPKPRHHVENTGSMLNQKRRAKKSSAYTLYFRLPNGIETNFFEILTMVKYEKKVIDDVIWITLLIAPRW